jgi:hypothetical protein
LYYYAAEDATSRSVTTGTTGSHSYATAIEDATIRSIATATTGSHSYATPIQEEHELRFTYSDESHIGDIDESAYESDSASMDSPAVTMFVDSENGLSPTMNSKISRTSRMSSPERPGYEQFSDSDSSQSDLQLQPIGYKKRRLNYFLWALIVLVFIGAVIAIPFGLRSW